MNTTTTPTAQDLARDLGVDTETVRVYAEQAEQATGDALTDDGDLTPAGVEAVREQVAQTRPTLTVTVDMEHDLAEAGQLPYVDDYDGDYDALLADRTELVEPMAAAWVAAAERIGLEWGYHVDAVATRDASVTWTHTEDADSLDTVERQIWQAAHDAIA